MAWEEARAGRTIVKCHSCLCDIPYQAYLLGTCQSPLHPLDSCTAMEAVWGVRLHMSSAGSEWHVLAPKFPIHPHPHEHSMLVRAPNHDSQARSAPAECPSVLLTQPGAIHLLCVTRLPPALGMAAEV